MVESRADGLGAWTAVLKADKMVEWKVAAKAVAKVGLWVVLLAENSVAW